ncbi:hypothetical protein EZS27_024257, partial [termite gut metagenome]
MKNYPIIIENYPVALNPQKLKALDGNRFVIFNDLNSVPLYSNHSQKADVTMAYVCLRGHIRMNIDSKEYTITPGMMTVLLPDHYIQHLEVSKDFVGVFLSLSRTLTREIFPQLSVLFFFILNAKNTPCIHLKENELNLFMEYSTFLWKKITTEYSADSRQDILSGLLRALFYEINNIQHKHCMKNWGKSPKEKLFLQFVNELEQTLKTERNVSYYAKKLSVSSKHLSETVKEITGKPTGEWINYFVILEAKTLLLSSQKN